MPIAQSYGCIRYIYFDPNILRKYAPKAGKFPPLKVRYDDDNNEIEEFNLLNLFPKEFYKDAFILFIPMTSKGKGDAKIKLFNTLNTAGKVVGSKDLNDSNRDFNKSTGLKDFKNSVLFNFSNLFNPYNLCFYFSTPTIIIVSIIYFTDRKRSVKEESAGKFYNDDKEDKIKFEVNIDYFNNNLSKVAQALLPYLDINYPNYIYKKVFIEFNNLEIKYIFERPTPEEIREFTCEGRYFNYYRKGYISSEYPYKEKFGKDSFNIKDLFNALISNEESALFNNKDTTSNSIKGN
ncbi:uncharacterized protein B0T23DRAFT_401885 [Neurospora hispaniola]|uniref:Uncharacterized protein n=1 Tax=Neurospora hispaniola TaxID=588809 RepID=A0AAJ0MT40_9PEZI|nr:hypothetical protein B0T23DRAFT_401885 [Neurospora hispaniola]